MSGVLSLPLALAACVDHLTHHAFTLVSHLSCRGSLLHLLEDKAVDLPFMQRVRFALDAAEGLLQLFDVPYRSTFLMLHLPFTYCSYYACLLNVLLGMQFLHDLTPPCIHRDLKVQDGVSCMSSFHFSSWFYLQLFLFVA